MDRERWCWWQLLDICDIFPGFSGIELRCWEAFSLRWRVVFGLGLGGGVAFGVSRLCHTGCLVCSGNEKILLKVGAWHILGTSLFIQLRG